MSKKSSFISFPVFKSRTMFVFSFLKFNFHTLMIFEMNHDNLDSYFLTFSKTSSSTFSLIFFFLSHLIAPYCSTPRLYFPDSLTPISSSSSSKDSTYFLNFLMYYCLVSYYILSSPIIFPSNTFKTLFE